MSETPSTIATVAVVEDPKPPRRKRTPEEISIANLEKEQKKQQRDAKKEQYSAPLTPGTGIAAIAAMTILSTCSRNMSITNNAFRQMIASRYIFPPKKNINKFATGGIAEECISQLFCNVGLSCANLSEDANIIDLEIQVPIVKEDVEQIVPLKVSLKNSGNIKYPPILENYRGQKREEIRPLVPTFIIYTEIDIKRVRIVYLDEEILRKGYPDLSKEEFQSEIYSNGDSSISFKSGFLAKFIPRLPSEYILNATYPEELEGLSEQSLSRLALAEVVAQLNAMDTRNRTRTL